MPDFTPTSVQSYISHFENKFNGISPFYYETKTNTINFGYGLNLTAAEYFVAGDASLLAA